MFNSNEGKAAVADARLSSLNISTFSPNNNQNTILIGALGFSTALDFIVLRLTFVIVPGGVAMARRKSDLGNAIVSGGSLYFFTV